VRTIFPGQRLICRHRGGDEVVDVPVELHSVHERIKIAIMHDPDHSPFWVSLRELQLDGLDPRTRSGAHCSCQTKE
jgi:hypothetical protein